MYPYASVRRFLKDKGYERVFDVAFERDNPGYRLDKTLWEILCGDEYFLGRAFDWSATDEGRDFWAKIDYEWYSMCLNGLNEK